MGLVLVGLGLAMQFGLPLGRLPGDFTIRRGNTTVYLPFASSLLVSVLLSLVFVFVRR